MSATRFMISAYHIAESINLKNLKRDFAGELISASSSELFYAVSGGGLFYIFNYGIAAFYNVSDVEKSRMLSMLREYSTGPIGNEIFDDYYLVQGGEAKPTPGFNEMMVREINRDVVKITMFNLAQSVALDYYAQEADRILERVNGFATDLERTGTIRISKKNMLKFIGRTLNIKNRIIDNLYIFDVPDSVWEDSYLDEIHTGLVRVFDLKARFREVQSSLKNIEENLEIFMEVYQHRMSNMLEWIIIILILIEVVDMFIAKLF